MRTSRNSTRNTSTKSANNQQRKSFSNNLVILTGNLGADAVFFGANDSAASLRMATKSTFGEKEYVEWHTVVAFRELAKEVVEKCAKGRFIKVYGYLHHSQAGTDEAPPFKTEVVATRIKYLDRKK
ncbi:MAG TPA: single-stranded DNA-binding protein [Candidatus Angelobacter sp.]|nr:single-stranded DNA-binding protein [Candidatus Angelobacter sp.]